jgi:hypothetical protein
VTRKARSLGYARVSTYGQTLDDFEFEVLYQNTFTDQPNGFVAAPGTNATWQPRADGFATRFEVTRNW